MQLQLNLRPEHSPVVILTFPPSSSHLRLGLKAYFLGKKYGHVSSYQVIKVRVLKAMKHAAKIRYEMTQFLVFEKINLERADGFSIIWNSSLLGICRVSLEREKKCYNYHSAINYAVGLWSFNKEKKTVIFIEVIFHSSSRH